MPALPNACTWAPVAVHSIMERQQQAAAAAATLTAALAILHRGSGGGGGAAAGGREPLTAAMFLKPNPKALQAAMYLLYRCIRGAARTKKVRHSAGGRTWQ